MRSLRTRPDTRRLATVAAVSGLVLAGLAAGAPPASAGCTGACLAGRDPVASNCAASSYVQDSIKDTAGHVWGTLWDKYSSGCGTNWSVAVLTQDAVNHGYSIFVDVSTVDRNGAGEYMCYPGPSNTGALNEHCSGQHYSGTAYTWTDMVDGTNCTQGYVRLFDLQGQPIGFADTVDPGCPK